MRLTQKSYGVFVHHRVAVTKTPEAFDIFEIKFRKTTEGMKDENNNSL